MTRTPTTERELIAAERIRRSIQPRVDVDLDVFTPTDERPVRIIAPWARA